MPETKIPTQLLKDEHQEVLQKLVAMEKVIGRLDKTDKTLTELKDLTAYFKTDFWVHFTKEEEALFPEIETFLPRNAGPLGVMLMEHEELRKTNDRIQKAAADYLGDSGDEATKRELREQGAHFIGVLRDHIGKEDNILFGIADMHFDQQQIDKVIRLFHQIDSGHKSEDNKEIGIIEALRTRRSIKSYTTAAVPPDVLLEILDVTRYSPSGANKNNWRFVVTTKRDVIEKLAAVQPFSKWLASAQAAICIVGDPAISRYWLEDCCLAAYSIYLGALPKGVGVAWSAIYQSDNPAEDERRQNLVRELMGIPKGMKAPIVLGLGYPQNQPAPRTMTALEDTVFWEQYGQK
jgi:nitroreductase/hemerythrin-like domain-containing protein